MFSRPVSRTSCPSSTHALNTALTVRPPGSTGLSIRPAFKPVQRRLSSSKASCPPGSGRSGSESATSNAQSASSNDQREQQQTATSPGRERRSSNVGRRRTRYAAAGESTLNGDEASGARAKDAMFGNVPSVPPTSHLQERDVNLSTFFALHRPMSITTPIPPNTSTSTFASIFDRPAPKWRPADVIYTLNTAITSVDPNTPNQSTLHDSVLAQSSTHHTTDTQTQATVNLDDLIKNYRPFHKPPAPIPLDPAFASKSRAPTKSSKSHASSPPPPQSHPDPRAAKKTYTTTLTISESTHPASGAKTYTAEATPIVASASPTAPTAHVTDGEPHAYALPSDLARAELRPEPAVTKRMWLISVKRRRKLKMKKHKHKKLLRRTRNLRRREGRT